MNVNEEVRAVVRTERLCYIETGMNDTLWIMKPERPEASTLAAALDLPLPLAAVLANRGLLDADAARSFLFGSLEGLHDPYLMKGMSAAVARVERAIKDREKILIFGDYDVDGVLSVVMLYKALRSLGAEVDYFIPERLTDGYGIKAHHVDVPVERGTNLVISVDCGVKAVEFTNQARARGVEVIITDHHRPGDELPEAVAILNPVLEDSGYPDRDLAGVGVVFKFIQALLEKAGQPAGLPHYMKLVSIGTVADVAELKGENRIFVKQGLKGLRNVSNTGLRSLIDACGLTGRRISESDLGFRLGPRINAAGRMGKAELAVRLFFTDTVEEALGLVRELEDLNSRRQRTEERIFEEAKERVEARDLDRRYRCLILGSEEWHRGVIGIVASKLKDHFHRPVVLFSYQDGKAFGSGRSISECALIEFFDACRAHFLSYGGHRLAAGCTLVRENIPPFKAAMNALAEDRISDEDLQRKLRVDASLDLAAIDQRFLDIYALLVPFGVGNPKPVFVTQGAALVGEPQTIRRKHLKLLVRQSGRLFEALAWERADWASGLRRGDRLDLAYTISIAEYLGRPKTSLVLEDIKAR